VDRTVHVGRRIRPVDFHEVRDRRIGPIFSYVLLEALIGVPGSTVP
jgi:hypothetical protein